MIRQEEVQESLDRAMEEWHENEDYTSAHKGLQYVVSLYWKEGREVPREVRLTVNRFYYYFTQKTLDEIQTFLEKENWRMAKGCIDQLVEILNEANKPIPWSRLRPLKKQLPFYFQD